MLSRIKGWVGGDFHQGCEQLFVLLDQRSALFQLRSHLPCGHFSPVLCSLESRKLVLLISFSLTIPIATLGLVDPTLLAACAACTFCLEGPASLTSVRGPLGSWAEAEQRAIEARKDHLSGKGSRRGGIIGRRSAEGTVRLCGGGHGVGLYFQSLQDGIHRSRSEGNRYRCHFGVISNSIARIRVQHTARRDSFCLRSCLAGGVGGAGWGAESGEPGEGGRGFNEVEEKKVDDLTTYGRDQGLVGSVVKLKMPGVRKIRKFFLRAGVSLLLKPGAAKDWAPKLGRSKGRANLLIYDVVRKSFSVLPASHTTIPLPVPHAAYYWY